jgi:hypothetical protein
MQVAFVVSDLTRQVSAYTNKHCSQQGSGLGAAMRCTFWVIVMTPKSSNPTEWRKRPT